MRHSWWTMKFSFTVSGRGCVISFLVFYRRNLVHLFIYFYFYLFFTYLFIYLFFVTRLWPSGIVFCWIHVWINFISCFKFGCFFFSFLFFFFPGCSLFEVFFSFGLSGFRPGFVIFSFVIDYAQLLPRLVSVPVGQPPLLGF